MTTTLLTRDEVFEALKVVFDPEIGVNIVDLGLVYDADISETNDIAVTITLTSMGCPLGPVIISDIQQAAGKMVPGSRLETPAATAPPSSAFCNTPT